LRRNAGTLGSMVQFAGSPDANGTVLEINHAAHQAVGIDLTDVEGSQSSFHSMNSNRTNLIIPAE
jgi:hypothetical protein